MMDWIIFSAASYGLGLLTWLFYLAITHLNTVKKSLHPFAKFNAYLLLAVGLPLDVLTNVVLGSILFVELPREWLFTARLTRHKQESNGWRKGLALWLCEHLLDQFDSGNHCR